MGLSILVAGMQTAWFIKKDPAYLRMTKFFGKYLASLWFILNAILWTGYFVLEGFDFGSVRPALL
jgi:cytochrome bd ubiquinol oxidase subunit I